MVFSVAKSWVGPETEKVTRVVTIDILHHHYHHQPLRVSLLTFHLSKMEAKLGLVKFLQCFAKFFFHNRLSQQTPVSLTRSFSQKQGFSRHHVHKRSLPCLRRQPSSLQILIFRPPPSTLCSSWSPQRENWATKYSFVSLPELQGTTFQKWEALGFVRGQLRRLAADLASGLAWLGRSQGYFRQFRCPVECGLVGVSEFKCRGRRRLLGNRCFCWGNWIG